ncbi:putative periplasmic or secreted lipoprotein [Desulfocapsa sulfexigens DSM 10523]|uniref:Putative periplasmic or secreted lipoprotein n=1 Tax=Desulfocapsa sulfexigens (strain DSM 10523 / SB164P1) TaxID=1167006 RepID=M1P255_DESSD|nr:BON domain-containing protein [Desulfocapsa sulfexigens]AGF77563.1 putative periplasmic or secreted lipoprotein [Desulfocapsa sulfexigens DSM 10523]
MKVKEMYRMVLMAVVTVLLVATVPVLATASEADDSVESSAKSSYVFKNFLQNDDVTVKSMDGAVTLTGTVTEDTHKSLAQETVANLPGVKSVDNQLEVKGESALENSDSWITTKVKTALFFHRNVSAMTEVDTNDGIVTLQGEATSQAQKDLTTELVKDVVGVADVQNDMKVPEASMTTDESKISEKISDVGDSIDDASVTALVKMTLLYHRSTSALDTKVMTTNGQVTLEGNVGNAAEKDLATKYVQDVHGVNSVVNNMIVKKPITVKKSKSKEKIEGC